MKNKEYKRQFILQRLGKRGDERRAGIVQRACTISVGYVYLYSVIEIIWKSILGKTIMAGFIDIIRLLTMLLVYVFFLYDNKAFQGGKKDERLSYLSGLSNVFVFFYAFSFVVLEIVYKIINNPKHAMIGFDYGLLVTMIAVFGILMRSDEAYGLPTDYQGRILDMESKACARQRRILYVKQSVHYAAAFSIIGTAVTIYQSGGAFSLSYFAGTFILCFICGFLFQFLYGEYKVKKYNKKQKEMED